MTFKTVICMWSQEENLLFLAEGDLRHLEHVIVNTIPIDDYKGDKLDDESNQEYVDQHPNNTRANQEALCQVLVNEEGRWKLPTLKAEDVVREIRNGAEFIQVGWIL